MDWPHKNSPGAFQCTVHWRPDGDLERSARRVARRMGRELMFAAPVREGTLLHIRPGFGSDAEVASFKHALWNLVTGNATDAEPSRLGAGDNPSAPGGLSGDDAVAIEGHMDEPSRVFISYAQESASHSERVLRLADRLRGHGVEAWVDQYVVAPPEGWPQWMDQQIERADFIVAVCSPAYRRRMEGWEQTGKGLGATWESRRLIDMLYASGGRNERIVPVLFDGDTGDVEDIVPRQLRAYTRFRLEQQYETLYRHLTRQPAITAPPLGPRLRLEPRSVDGSATSRGTGTSPGVVGTLVRNFNIARLRAFRSELLGNVDGIKTAQLAYDAVYDRFIACGSAAEARKRLTPHLRDWIGGPGWAEIGWRPDGPVRGEYWVEVSANGEDFEVHGMIDADGDGRVAEVVASRSRNARIITPDDAY